VTSSWCTGLASPCKAATPAAAAASIRSFLRPAPGDNCRTRAVERGATSTTRSPRASSQLARCRPMPAAFSIAHCRCGQCAAHCSIRSYSATVASIRTEPRSRFVSGATAVAVCVDLCGSTPISIIAGSILFLRRQNGDPRLTVRLREPVWPRGHASVESSRGRRPGWQHTQRQPAHQGGRKYSSQPARSPTARYGRPTRSRHRYPASKSGSIGAAGRWTLLCFVKRRSAPLATAFFPPERLQQLAAIARRCGFI
jgi:hypothetical protein